MKILPDVNTNIIEKWEETERVHDQNRTLKGSENFIGPSRKRACTDLFCCVIFFLLFFGSVGTTYYILITGDVNRLGHGSDFRGDLCGISQLSNKKYTYYPNPQDSTIVLCLNSCPSTEMVNNVCYYDTDGVSLLSV